jgi:hypothetical protein
MADVASSLKNWSSTPASNNPTSATTIGTGLAPNFQQIQATLRNELATRSASVTAAATTDIGVKDEGTVLVTNAAGTIAITSFGTVSAGIKKLVTFVVSGGSLSLTHNATSLILPGSSNISVTTGASLMAESLGSGNWKIHWYANQDGSSILGVTPAQLQAQTYTTFTTGGTSTAYTLTPMPALTALTAGQRFNVTFNATAGLTPTLAISGLAAKSLKLYDSTGAKVAASASTVISGMNADLIYDGTDYVILNQLPNNTILQGHLNGLTMSTAGSSATMSIAAGQAADSNNALYITLAAAISKTTSAWAVGTGNGGLDTGAIANNTSYHFYLIRRPDTGVVDVVFSTSASLPTLPTNYTQYRRIGGARTNGSAQWTKFYQIGDQFYLTTPAASASNATIAITKGLVSLSVPTGISVVAMCTILIVNAGTRNVRLYADADDDLAVTEDNLTNSNSAASTRTTFHRHVMTNTSGQVAWRADVSTTGGYLQTIGWIDTRGQD